MKKQKSGISLIVLVITIIVIIILAVAVILSIANNNPIENAKEARIKNDLKTIEEELTLKQASNYVEEHANNKTPSEITIDDLASAAEYTDKLDIVNGKLYIKSGSFENEEKLSKELEIDILQKATLKVGDEYTYKNEPFYVIGGDTVGTEISDSTQNVLLLAKYSLTSDGKSQDTSGASNECVFCSQTAWSGANVETGDNLNAKETIKSDATSVVSKAIAYGESLRATGGRLITYEEANKLNPTILYGKYTENGLNYWLGSAGSQIAPWFVNSGESNFGYDEYNYDGYGVRPVITVPASSIK